MLVGYRALGLSGLGLSLQIPVMGAPTISSPFGPRAAPTAGASSDHQGIDYAVPIGTPVYAATDGTVVFAGVQSGFGNVVQISNGAGVITTYGHLSSLGVQQGQQISAGDQVALSGASGTVSGPNLHFQVSVDGTNVDPETLLTSGASPVDSSGMDVTGDPSTVSIAGYDVPTGVLIAAGIALAASVAYSVSR